MTRGAFYIRVSTEDQLYYSPDAQLRALTEYAKKNKIIVDKQFVFIDEGISAKTANRPAFQRMIQAAKKKAFDMIIVHKLDRFARNREDSVVYKALLRKECGVRVVSATEPIEDDKFGIIIEAMLEAMAEFYSKNLAEEVKKGQSEKARQGGFMARPPLGYRVEEAGKPPLIVPEEAKTVRLIFDLFNTGNSCYGIALHLNGMGLTMPTGHKFSSTGVKYIVRNPFYTGLARWNMRDSNNKNRIKDPEEWITEEGQHEEIISREVYEKAQARVKAMRKKMRPTEVASSHLFSGLVRCGNCGGSMSFRNRKYPFFRCDYYNKGKCRPSQHISTKKLTAFVLDKMRHDAEDKEVEYELHRTSLDALEEDILQRQLQQIQGKLERVKAAYSAGVDTLEEYRANKSRILEEEAELKRQVANLPQKSEPDIGKFHETLKKTYATLINDKVSLEEKQKTIRSCVKQIVFTKEAIYIRYFLSE